ncbi:MAG: hypothetical protein AB8B92_10930 [Gammaproteobacteria bacterium]
MKYKVLTNINKNKAFGFPIIALLLLIIPIFASAEVKNTGSDIKTGNVEQLVKEVLMNVETSLAQVESNTARSLSYVEKALAGIRDIKGNLSPDTHAELKSPLLVEESKEYWFIYPRLGKEVLTNEEKFPTLYGKFESGVLYHGEEATKSEVRDTSAYFDYAFAYASLITAREALGVENYREARNSLKWVFESVYVNPDFYVAQFDGKQKIDKLHNLNNHNPVQFSSVNLIR